MAIHTHCRDQKAECDTLITLTDVQRGLEMPAEAVRTGHRAVLLAELLADSFRQVAALTAVGQALFAAGETGYAADRTRAARRILDALDGARAKRLAERLRAAERKIELAPPDSRAG